MAGQSTLSVPTQDLPRSLQASSRRNRVLVGGLLLVTSLLVLVASYVIGTTTLGVWVVAGTIGLLLGIGITLRPEVGAYVLIAMVYLNLSSILELQYGIPSINKYLVALIAVGTVINRGLMRRRPIKIDRTQGLILLYGVILLLSTARAEHQDIAWLRVVDWAKDYAILFVLVQLSDQERNWKRMQWILISVAFLVAGLSAFQTISGDYSNNFGGLANAPIHQITSGFDSHRVTGPLDDPNFYAQVLLMVMPIALYRFFDEWRLFPKLFAGLAAVTITLTAIFTYSRGAALALLVLAVLVVWERRWNPYKVAFVVLVVILVISPFLPVGYFDRLVQVFDVFSANAPLQSERSLTGRTSEMIIAVQMFLDHPVFGVGPDNYEKFYLDYSYRLGLDNRLQERQAHSLLLETAAELGVIGVIVFTAIFVSAIRASSQAKRRLRAAGRRDLLPWITGVQFALVSYMTTSLFLHGSFIRYFWLLLGIVISAGHVADYAIHRATANADHDQEVADAQRPDLDVNTVVPGRGQLVSR
ncbi:MAG: hypothetical protein Kow0077_07360 [Anaerolineae bacterium]